MEAVRQVVLDYVDSAYLIDPKRVQGCIHPDLAKIGFVWEGDHYAAYRMTYHELLETVSTDNQDGHIPTGAPKAVTLFEVLDQTAVVKLEA